MLDLARGDVGMSRHLRNALNILADSGQAKDLEKHFREIAKGNGSLRDLRNNESFLRLSDSVLTQAQEDQAARTPEEKQRLIDEGNATLERYRHEDSDIPAPEPPTPTESRTRPAPGPPHNTEPTPPRNTTAEPPRTRRQTWRDVVVTPDEPDEDDLYFQQRQQRGWLQ